MISLLTLNGFLGHFVDQHQQRRDRPFCFILGAGASIESDIPGGAELARRWLHDHYRDNNHEGLSLEEWATAERLGIEGFDLKQLGRYYSQVYSIRYRIHEESGFAFLEDQMEGKEPSFGYSVLAYLLSETAHKIVITTNFDNLVADALSIHSTRFPLVIGHDSNAGFVRSNPRRPLIAKVHGSLGFTPKSKPEDLGCLDGTWTSCLEEIFRRYTPIVIGYDGNDGSLMHVLEDLPEGVPDKIYWCYYCPDGHTRETADCLDERIRELVSSKNGFLVPIPGFDDLMARLLDRISEPLKVPDLLGNLRERAKRREEAYEQQHAELMQRATQNYGAPHVSGARTEPGLREALEGIAAKRAQKPAWQWVNEALKETNLEKQDEILKEGLSEHPDNADFLGDYALVLHNRGNIKEAEKFYNRALFIERMHANNLGNYGLLMKQKGLYEDALSLYTQAISVNPQHASHLCSYGQLLIGLGLVDSGIVRLRTAWESRHRDIRFQAELAYSLWLGTYIANAEENIWERVYKWAIEKGFSRAPWDFSLMLDELKSRGKTEILGYADALALAYVAESAVPLLSQFDRWKSLVPLHPGIVDSNGSISA